MGCGHRGLWEIQTVYDRKRRLLIFYWTCSGCGTRLDERERREYEPRFEPAAAHAPPARAAGSLVVAGSGRRPYADA